MPDPTALDPAATLARVEGVLRARRRADHEDLLLAAHWADLHGSDPRWHPDGTRNRTTGNRLVTLGGPGTPRVQDLCLAELAIARRASVGATRALTADALDLIHRLPRVWAVVETHGCEAWVARKVAQLTRDLPAARVGLVDTAVARAIGHQAPGRVLAIAEAKTIEADPDAHAARHHEEQRRRYARLTRTDAHGLRHLIARVGAGDAAWIDAMLDRVADILAPQHPDTTTRDELRSHALGWLARPAELLTLLLEHAHPGQDGQPDQDGQPEDDRPEHGHPEHAHPEPGDGEPGDGGHQDASAGTPEVADPQDGVDRPSRAHALPADLLDALRGLDPRRLRPAATLYLHLHAAALDDTGTAAVARVEDIGPVLPRHLPDLLAGCHVTLTPVRDLADRIDVNGYEHPEAIKEHIHLITPTDCFPHSASRSRRLDHDHCTPYRPGGPPGQTSTHNTGPLTRTHHRVKTHAGHQVRQLGPGEYLWRTPHGHYRLVNHEGTHTIPTDIGDTIYADTG